ncbi:MAG: cytochrome c biogenesis protein CcsA [Verrucomicrobia bacterium]|nr:cytochrome c biogenesis protein CcsA [Verrucomicrobiota bacterium]
MNKRSTLWKAVRAACCLTFALSTQGLAQTGTAAPVAEGGPGGLASSTRVVRRVDPAVVALLQRVPIQDGGRIKPLDTYARFELLKLHGKRRMRLTMGDEAVRIGATEWLLTCLLYPEWAVHYPTFTLDNSDVITAIGAIPHEKRRDRYSYAELYPARERLMELASQYAVVDAKQRSAGQAMIVNLAGNLSDFEYLLQYLGFARARIALDPELFPTLVETPTTLRVTEYLGKLPAVRTLVGEIPHGVGKPSPVVQAMLEQVTLLQHHAENGMFLHWLPPADAQLPAWLAVGDVIDHAFAQVATSVPELAFLETLEALVAARDNPVALPRVAAQLVDQLIAGAEARGEYRKVSAEVAFYRANYFFWALSGFLLSFLLLALTWLNPNPAGRGGQRANAVNRALAVAALLGGTGMLIAGIVVRCYLRGRPPVSTLYETILFITAVAILVALLMELMNRQRIALAMAPVLGMLGMFLAIKYEAKEASDTMPSLQAVLDTNFWLSTHVTCVTIGYAACLLAGAIAHLYVLGRVFHLRQSDRAYYATIARMVYGVLCFGLLFSFVGTMLGGIWANYSWGRFWGWDPKENGALMIVLWVLIVLHARMGGYVRDFGVSILAIIGACIVAFSWWGVNLLGVGLHSYGFTSGIWGALRLYWGVELAVVLMGLAWWLGERRGADSRTSAIDG